jgi:hypothetical protein
MTHDARVRAGLARLAALQASDGGFEVVVLTGGPGFPTTPRSSPFVTGLILEALRALDDSFDTGPLVSRALGYLRAAMEDDGFWRFYRCEPPLRRDLDSSTVTLRALRHAGVCLDYAAAAARLRAYRTARGRFRTWAEARPSWRARLRSGPRALLRRWFNPVDPVVNANVLAFLEAIGERAPAVDAFLCGWGRSHRALGATPYYVHPECLAYALSKVTESRPAGDALREVTATLIARLLTRADDPATAPFLQTRRLAAALRLGAGTADLGEAIGTVAARQHADGSWPWGAVWTAVRWAPGAPRPLLGSPAMETALAIEVLGRWQQR